MSALFKRTKKAAKKEVKPSKKKGQEKKAEQAIPIGSVLIKQPKISEKTIGAGEHDQYVFVVAKQATKPEIKKQVEKLYNVDVKKVRSMNIHNAATRFHGSEYPTTRTKKMVVTVKKGQRIDITGNI